MFPLPSKFFNFSFYFCNYFSLSICPGLNVYHVYITGINNKSISACDLKLKYIKPVFISNKCRVHLKIRYLIVASISDIV